MDLENITRSEMCQVEKDRNLWFYSRGCQATNTNNTNQPTDTEQKGGHQRGGAGGPESAGSRACGGGTWLRAEHAGEETMSCYKVTHLGLDDAVPSGTAAGGPPAAGMSVPSEVLGCH